MRKIGLREMKTFAQTELRVRGGMRIQSRASVWTLPHSPLYLHGTCRPTVSEITYHVLCTVKSSPPSIHTMSQSLKTENMPDMASAFVELILKRETDNK